MKCTMFLQQLYLIIPYVMMLCNWALAAVERFAVERACASDVYL